MIKKKIGWSATSGQKWWGRSSKSHSSSITGARRWTDYPFLIRRIRVEPRELVINQTKPLVVPASNRGPVAETSEALTWGLSRRQAAPQLPVEMLMRRPLGKTDIFLLSIKTRLVKEARKDDTVWRRPLKPQFMKNHKWKRSIREATHRGIIADAWCCSWKRKERNWSNIPEAQFNTTGNNAGRRFYILDDVWDEVGEKEWKTSMKKSMHECVSTFQTMDLSTNVQGAELSQRRDIVVHTH